MAMAQVSSRSASAFLGTLLVASLLVFGSLSGTSGATIENVSTETEYRDALGDLSADAAGPHTINITADFTIGTAGDPTYTGDQDLTINGNGHTVDSTVANTRFLLHNSDADLTIENLTVEGFNRTATGGAIRSAQGGDVTVTGSTFRNNTSSGNGGAIITVDPGAVTVTGSTFSGNHSSGVGASGGAISSPGGTTVTGSTFTDNEADGGGGAIVSNPGGITVTGSTFSGNEAAAAGGAVFTNNGDIVLTGSTFSGNTAGGFGGAAHATLGDAAVIATNSTFTGNTSVTGGAVSAGSGGVELTHATVAGNSGSGGANVRTSGDLSSFGSVVSDATGVSCQVGGATTSTYSYNDDGTCGFAGTGDTSDGPDPQLGALANNGGPTRTMLPLAGSPLIDAIPVADCHDTVTTDQRGITRPQDGDGDGVLACDIGAVEVEPAETARPARPVEGDPTFTG